MRTSSDISVVSKSPDELLQIWKQLEQAILSWRREADANNTTEIFLKMLSSWKAFNDIPLDWKGNWTIEQVDMAVRIINRVFKKEDSSELSLFLLKVITGSDTSTAKEQLVLWVNYLLSIAELLQQIHKEYEIDFWETKEMLTGYISQDNTGTVQRVVERLTTYEWRKIDHIAIFSQRLERASAARTPVEKIEGPEPLDLTDEQQAWSRTLEKHLWFFDFTPDEQVQIRALFPHITTLDFEECSIYGIPTLEDVSKMEGYLRNLYQKDPVSFLIRRVRAESDDVTLKMIGQKTTGDE